MNKIAPTALMNHVRYFDENKDGTITYGEITRRGQALGFGAWESHVVLALPTVLARGEARHGFDISVDRVEKQILAGSTGVFDSKGNTTQEAVDTFFADTDKNKDGQLDEAELQQRVNEDVAKANPETGKVGRAWKALGSMAGWKAVLSLVEKNFGRSGLEKSDVQAIYNGDIFFELAKKHAENAAQKKK